MDEDGTVTWRSDVANGTKHAHGEFTLSADQPDHAVTKKRFELEKPGDTMIIESEWKEEEDAWLEVERYRPGTKPLKFTNL